MFLYMFLVVLFVIVIFERHLALRKSDNKINSGIAISLLRIAIIFITISILAWPVITHPVLFNLECRLSARNDLEPSIDASNQGYFDQRIYNANAIRWNRDDGYMRQNISNLRQGRIKFFEIENHINSHLTGLKYFQFYLLDNGAAECTLTESFGFKQYDNRSQKSDQCLALKVTSNPESRYIISLQGDLISQNATTTLKDIKSNETVRIYKSLLIDQLFGGYQMCPTIYKNGHVYSGHSHFTEIVFKDRYGRTIYDTAP